MNDTHTQHMPLFMEYIQIRENTKRVTHPEISPDLECSFSQATQMLCLTTHFSSVPFFKKKGVLIEKKIHS